MPNKITEVALLTALSVLPVMSIAQKFPDENGETLQGVTSFDAKFAVSVFLNVTANEDRFRENGSDAFTLALRRDGVRVEESASNYLFCNVSAAQALEIGYVAVWDLVYYAFNPDGLHALLWKVGGIMTFGPGNFKAEAIAQECADAFASEWLKWNPK